MDISKISKELNEITCPVHGKMATVVITAGDNILSDIESSIKITNACCEELIDRIDVKAGHLLADDLSSGFLNIPKL